jgi:hypothetical protein
MKFNQSELDKRGHYRLISLIGPVAAKIITCIFVVTFCLSVTAKSGSVTLTISEPKPALVVGETFETSLKFSTNSTVLGAYHIIIHYDYNVLKILQITIPIESDFYDNTFVDTNSFSSGETQICAFQTENLFDEPAPKVFATVRWELLAEPTPCSKIYIVPKSLIDVLWEPIEDVKSSVLLLNNDPMPPTVDFVGCPGSQRSTIRYIEVRFGKHTTLSRNALILEGRNTGVVDLSKAEFWHGHDFYGIWPITKAYWLLSTSLPDDIYTVTIVASEVRLATNPNIVLDGNSDCLPGGDYVTSFHRLLGDATGDVVVGLADLLNVPLDAKP